jgi:hypothetical protein
MITTSAPAQPFTISPRGSDYWMVDELEPLLAYFRARPDLHEWITASVDKKSYKEITRFYHKPRGLRHRVEPAGIGLDREGGPVWLRLVGSDLPRVRRIVEELAAGQAVAEVQECLF